MYRNRLNAFLLCLCLFVLAPAICAADDWLPIDPADLKATSDPNAAGADAVILYREETYNDIMKFQSYYFRIKILTEKGKQEWSDVVVPYEKTHFGKVGSIKARTIHADGTIIPFGGQSFDKMVEKTGHRKIFARVFTLPAVEIGSIIEYKYDIRWDDLVLYGADWTVQMKVFQRKVVFHYYPYIGMVVNDHNQLLDNINFVPYMPTSYPQPKVTRLPNDKTTVDMTVENVPTLQEEEYMAPPDQLAYRVKFFYTNGETVKAGIDDYWKQVGKFWNKSIEKFSGHEDKLSAAVAQIVAPADTAEQKARKIYAFVQSMQNLSYGRERTAGENKNDKLPTSAVEVFEQKRGYDDDLTRLYVALARAVGLQAYVMRVSSRDEYLFIKAMLDERQLDSEIAIVEIDGKEVYLDPGTKFCPFGTLDWKKTTVQGQRQTASGKVDFSETPIAPYKENQVKHLADLVLAENGDVTGKVTLGFLGQQAIFHRQAAIKVDDLQRKKDLEDEVSHLLPAGSSISMEKVWNQDDIDKPLIVRFDVTVPHFATVTGKRVLLPFVLFHVHDTSAFTHPTRVQAVYFAYPYLDIDELKLQLPASLQVEEIPKVAIEKRDFCIYGIETSIDKQTVKFHREFAMGDFVFGVKQYSDLKNFFEKVRGGDDQQAVLRLAATAQMQGEGAK